ncbi:zinc ribbon domain-containing protein [Chitinophaga horti]|uniref:Zinc ribbon domain-containing protein n=1 Tax=Chitinophaga horti TaxID=2920382 RepID=A0ABY6J226_9BACT|nr:zinc ribbon domain-containing protein [Chitinophaga horti]UYQ93710.1 zinc ribbon domain-containing protein [Chitinophaga horti]
MHYLKCDNCGYLNPLKSEYATFCEHCGKKLKDNFGTWKLTHPQSDFEKFKQEVGLSGDDAAIGQKQFRRSKTSPKVKRIIAIAVAIVVGVVVAGFAGRLGERVAKSFNEVKAPAEWLTGSWKTFTPFTGSNFTIETPVNLTARKYDLPPDVQQHIKDMHAYENAEKDGMKIAVSKAIYNDGITTDLNGAADGTINSLQQQPDVSQFDFTRQEISVNGTPAILQKGSYVYRKSTALQFITLSIAKDNELYQVMSIYGAADDTGSTVAGRFIRSVKL